MLAYLIPYQALIKNETSLLHYIMCCKYLFPLNSHKNLTSIKLGTYILILQMSNKGVKMKTNFTQFWLQDNDLWIAKFLHGLNA